MNAKNIVLALTITTLLFAGAPRVSADDCSTDYGGTTTCHPTDLFINKQVQDPKTGTYVENINTAMFSKGSTVVFKFIVTNNSNQVMNDVKVTDGVPDNFEITDASASYKNVHDFKKLFEINSDKKNVTFYLDEMAVGQVKEMFVWTTLVGTFPNEPTFCRDNWANVTSSERPNGDKNFARVCIASTVNGSTTLPVAGAEDIFMIAPFIVTGLGGFALLRRKK